MRKDTGESGILFSVADGIARLVFSRPERRNALDASMRQALAVHLKRIEADDTIRAVLLTSTGTVFCAGQDLDDPLMRVCDGENPPVGKLLHEEYNPLMRRLYRCVKPTVCAVNGAAIGGGANIALACDLVIAARSARFVQPYVNLGITLDAGGSFLLPHRIGQARAMGLALLGGSIDAETAASWGLIWRVVADEELSAEAEKTARQLVKGPAAAITAIKASIKAASANTFDNQLDYERDLQKWLSTTNDYAEGIRAFKERRAPVFR